MPVRNIENYSTLRWHRQSSALLGKKITNIKKRASITDVIEPSEPKNDSSVLLEIERHLTTAHDLYFSRLFAEAIEEYRTTQTLISNLLNSSESDGSSSTFDSLLRVGVDFISSIESKIPETVPDLQLSATEALNSVNIVSEETKEIKPTRRVILSPTTRVSTKTGEERKPIKKRSVRLYVGERTVDIAWEDGKEPSTTEFLEKIYDRRTKSEELDEAICKYFSTEEFSVMLPHIMSYVIPVALGDCYYGLGDYEEAEKNYLAAADYKYINQRIEVPSLWIKMAQNVLAWGDMLYKEDMFQEALNVYRLVLEAPGSASVVNSESYLYKHNSLKITGSTVSKMLAEYEKTGNTGDINPQLAIIVLQVKERMIKLSGGLDFRGIPLNLVPVWTFEYLQNVARYFAQQAIQAEREYIDFIETADNKKLTRQQLKQAVDLAKAEVNLAKKQKDVAVSETKIYQEGLELATLRRQNMQVNKNAYSLMSWEKIRLDASNAWYSGPDTKIKGTDKKAYEILFDNTLRTGTISREYELGVMERQIAELRQAEEMAKAQYSSAQARVSAAEQLERIAMLREAAAKENLIAFDNQTFTADVWTRMGNFMKNISDNYLDMAINISRLMQKAYNFEFDAQQNSIKPNYSSKSINGLLASNALLLDIDSFTYDMINSVKTKSIPIKQTLSLATRHPYLFETSFRTTGVMEFETYMEDFDMDYPGTYNRRIEAIEVIVEGLIPSGGVKGFLTNCGISRYRTANFNTIKFRIQPKDTLVLSEYKVTGDSFVFSADPAKLKLFEGAGICGSWKIEIPKFSNDLDYNYITDVKIIFYYKAFYNENLAQSVRNNLKTLAGINKKSKILPLRYIFPDSYYYFLENGIFSFELDKSLFPYSESGFKISSLNLLAKNSNGADSKLTVLMKVPSGKVPVKIQTGSNVEITPAPTHPWDSLTGGDALGKYTIEILKEDNPSLVSDGKLQLESIEDLVLLLEYDYTPAL